MDWTYKLPHCLLRVHAFGLNVRAFHWLALVLEPALIGYGLGHCSKSSSGQNRKLGRVRIRDSCPTGRSKRRVPSGAGAPAFVPSLG